MDIYFDNGATTRAFPEVREMMDKVLEEEYQSVFERNLTLNRLGEVLLSPCCPDRGEHLSYDYHLAPSVYVENDIIRLIRLKELIKNNGRSPEKEKEREV